MNWSYFWEIMGGVVIGFGIAAAVIFAHRKGIRQGEEREAGKLSDTIRAIQERHDSELRKVREESKEIMEMNARLEKQAARDMYSGYPLRENEGVFKPGQVIAILQSMWLYDYAGRRECVVLYRRPGSTHYPRQITCGEGVPVVFRGAPSRTIIINGSLPHEVDRGDLFIVSEEIDPPDAPGITSRVKHLVFTHYVPAHH
jgi:hypothetical protein